MTKLQKILSQTRRASTALLLVGLSLGVAGCFKTRAEIEQERQEQEMRQTMSKNVYEAHETAQASQAQLGKLQGKIEEIEHFRRREAEEQRKTMNVLGEKITQLEERLAGSEKMQAELVEEMKKLKTENLRAISEPSGGGVKKNSAEKSNLKAGLEAYNQRRFDEAVEHLAKVVEQGPKAKDFVKANYFLGQAEYGRKNYAEAIVAFSTVFEKDAKDPQWRKATLRIAESFQKLGKKKDAKPFAQALVEKFPDSSEAKQAKKFL